MQYLTCYLQMIACFFCKANKEECQTILRILKEYETVSGQQINFQKSSIQFGHKIEESKRQDMRDILGIQNLVGMDLIWNCQRILADQRYKFSVLYMNGWQIG